MTGTHEEEQLPDFEDDVDQTAAQPVAVESKPKGRKELYAGKDR
jgi:hypothetical protein